MKTFSFGSTWTETKLERNIELVHQATFHSKAKQIIWDVS